MRERMRVMESDGERERANEGARVRMREPIRSMKRVRKQINCAKI